MWFRLYTDILTSRKVLTLEPELFRAWIICLALTKEGGGLLPPIEDVAFGLRTSTAEAQRLTEALVMCGLLDNTEDGLTPHNWDERQFLSDDDPTAAIRARRYRQSKRNVTDESRVTSQINHGARDRAETEPEPEPEQSRGGAGDAPASPAKRGSARRPVQCDEDFLAELQSNPAYSVFDVKAVYHRMVAWCGVKGKQPTRARLVNWLNREDRPMTAEAKPPKNKAAYVGAPVLALAPAPTVATDEANAYMAEYVEDLIAREDFAQLGHEYDAIVQRGGAKADWEIRTVAYYELHKDEPATLEQVAELKANIQALSKR